MDFDNVNEIITPTKTTSLTVGGTGALFIPSGTVGERPVSPQSGYIRFNTTDTVLEYYNGVAIQWQTFGSSTLNSLLSVSGTGMLVQTSPGVYAARSIAGTTNRVTVTNGDGVAGNPTLDIAATYVGQSSITTLGTVGTGIWQGTAVGATFGGTGQTVYAVGDILYANTTTTLAKLADIATGNALISGGVSTAPSWGKIGLATHVSGTLGVGNGGTGVTTTPTNGQILVGNGTTYTVATLGSGTGISTTTGSGTLTINNTGVTSIAGTTNQVTASAATGAVTLSTPATFTAPGYVAITTGLYESTTTGITAAGATLGTATALTTSFNLVTTTAAGTGVSLPAPTLAGWPVTIRNGGANTLNIYPNSATATINGGAAGAPITLATGATVTIEASTSGASAVWFSRSSFGTGGTGTVTSVSSSSTTGLTLTTTNPTTTPAIAMAGTLNVGFGGTGVTTTPTNGQLLIGNGTNYTVATLGAGTGISTTVGAGTLTINNTGVTSVGLALPSIFTVSGSPVTTTGTLTGTLNTQAANTVFAGPTTGTAVPTFRTLAIDELNNVTAPTPTAGQYLLFDGSVWVPYGGAGVGGGLRTWGGNVASQTGTSVITPGVTPPTIAQGTQIATLTLTPLSTSSKFTVQMSLSVSASTNNNVHTCAIFRDSTYIGGAIQTFASGGNSNAISITLTDAPATASPVTYSARYGTSANTWYINRRTAENTYGGVQSGFEIQEY